MSAALSFAESIAILAQHGVLEHLNKMSWSAPVVAVVAPQDYEVMAAYLTNIDVIDSRDLRDDISESMIILDCAKCDVLQNVSLELRTKNVVLSIFTDGIALYQCKCLDYLPKYSEGKKFFLITSPRSGSTFICDMLTSAGVFGSPTEHLKAWVAEALVAANANFSDFIDALHKASATSNGVFGSKVIIDDLFTFLPRFSDAIFETLRGATVFFLTRADKSAQAMSAVRADVLSLYHVHTGEEARRLHGLDFDPEPNRVFNKERWILRQEADLLNELNKHDIYPILLSYDIIIQSRQAAENTIIDIAHRLAIDDYERFNWPTLTRISAMVRPRGLLKYRDFRASIHLYSARSEPSLNEVLGGGWLTVEHWGVRADWREVEINVPTFANMVALELEINMASVAPPRLRLGDLEIQIPKNAPERVRLLLRVLGRERIPGRIVIDIIEGELAIEEIIFYENIPKELVGENDFDKIFVLC